VQAWGQSLQRIQPRAAHCRPRHVPGCSASNDSIANSGLPNSIGYQHQGYGPDCWLGIARLHQRRWSSHPRDLRRLPARVLGYESCNAYKDSIERKSRARIALLQTK
jgi:hypothetical protein